MVKEVAGIAPASGPTKLQAELRAIRLHRYLSRRDWEWLQEQDPAAARKRRAWCFGQFLQLCLELHTEQRRLSRLRSEAQCAPVGDLLHLELTVNLQIAELALRGSLHFAGLGADVSPLIDLFQNIERIIALPSASIPTLA